MTSIGKTVLGILALCLAPAWAHGRGTLTDALYAGDPDRVRAALAAGEDPNAPDYADLSPLARACFQMPMASGRDREVIQVLLAGGARPEGRSRDGGTALHSSRGNPDCLEPLLAAGADPNARAGYPNSTCAFAQIPAMEAVINGRDPQVAVLGLRALLAAGADPGIRGCDGGSMHLVVARAFLKRSGLSNTPPGWWKPYVAMWLMLDRARMADAEAQETMGRALKAAMTVEQGGKP
jgi:ankyrin repeat protein